MNIEECIEDCRACGLTGWELVSYAQGAVMRQMAYSYDNPLALPGKAFKQGKGYGSSCGCCPSPRRAGRPPRS